MMGYSRAVERSRYLHTCSQVSGRTAVAPVDAVKSIIQLCVLGLIGLVALCVAPRVYAETVILDGIVTDGEFLSPRFVPNPTLPGGGSTMNVDQLGLTNTPLTIALEFAHGVLGDDLMDGYSFLILDTTTGQTTGSNLSFTGSLGDPSMGGFIFESTVSGASSRALVENGVLSVVLPITGGSNSSGNFLAASPSGLLTLMSAPLPASVQTVGDLAAFLQTTNTFTSGTLPVEFFASNGVGETMLVTTDIDFVVSAEGELPAVPLPGAIWMFGAGLVAMARWMLRRRAGV